MSDIKAVKLVWRGRAWYISSEEKFADAFRELGVNFVHQPAVLHLKFIYICLNFLLKCSQLSSDDNSCKFKFCKNKIHIYKSLDSIQCRGEKQEKPWSSLGLNWSEVSANTLMLKVKNIYIYLSSPSIFWNFGIWK